MNPYGVDSRLHCPRDGKRLVMDIGAHESDGDLEIRHWCLHCGYSERGPVNPTVARTSSSYMAELLARVRAGRDQGVEIPMRTDLPAVEEVESL